PVSADRPDRRRPGVPGRRRGRGRARRYRMILAGDIGGTKTVLALFDVTSPGPQPVLARGREEGFHCADFPSLEAILDQFLRPEDRAGLAAACFGLAGRIAGGTAKITNLPWTIDAAALTTKLGAPVALLNDLQATALGVIALPATAF